MRQFAATLILTGVLHFQAPAQSGLELVRPDAGFIMGIEWRRIADSPLGAELNDQIRKAKMPPLPGMLELQNALLRDLDSILIAAPASGLSGANAKPPVLAIVKGRFGPGGLHALDSLKGKGGETYRSVELIALPNDTPAAAGAAAARPSLLALLDANTILAGDRAEIRGAIDRVKSGRLAATSAGILSGVGELAAKNDVWMVFDLPPAALKNAPPAAAQMFAGVRGAELGMSFQQGFGLLLNIRAKDADSATSMAQALQGLIAMGAMSQTQSPEAAELVKKIRISPESSRVRLALNLDRAEVQKMIEAAKASAAKSAAPSAPAARAPEPAGPKSIRITGLDGGPVEVPVPPKK